MADSLPPGAERLLREVYAAFNKPDLQKAMRHIRDDVLWPAPDERTEAVGHDAVRVWRARQLPRKDSRIAPQELLLDRDGFGIVVKCHQLVRDNSDAIVVDRKIEHVYVLREGLIARMTVRAT
jgi:hypothetical protein